MGLEPMTSLASALTEVTVTYAIIPRLIIFATQDYRRRHEEERNQICPTNWAFCRNIPELESNQ